MMRFSSALAVHEQLRPGDPVDQIAGVHHRDLAAAQTGLRG
jgi:hypothetical protein